MKVLYSNMDQTAAGHLTEPKLETLTERHRIRLSLPELHPEPDLLRNMNRADAEGIVIGMSRGWPRLRNLRALRKILRQGKTAWLYWPLEQAIECVDAERMRSLWAHWFAIGLYNSLAAAPVRLWMAHRLTPLASEPAAFDANPGVNDDAYKQAAQNQWDNNPCGSQYTKQAPPHTLDWFLEVEAYRYGHYAPWMPAVMEFSLHPGQQILEIGGGLGTDLCQFALNGAHVTDVDLAAGHLVLAQENFRRRGLTGNFIQHDAEILPFGDNSFDLVYSNGVIHHTPNTGQVIHEIWRVLKPGGQAILMVYAENSWNYWIQVILRHGLLNGMLQRYSVAEIMSRTVELTETGSRPLVKVYTKRRLARMLQAFGSTRYLRVQLTRPELPRALRWLPLGIASGFMGWNLVIKAMKPLPS